MTGHHRRGPWSQAEDQRLIHLIESQGPLNWVRISQLLGSRTPKQCRERFHQNLKPNLNHDPITTEEGVIIERMVQDIGKRWAEIARHLHGRSDNAVKNWWNGSQNRRKRSDRRKVNAGSYGEGPETVHYIRASMTTPRPRSMTLATRNLPPLIPGSFHDYGRHHVETPLLSPAFSSTSAHAPSLEPDRGSPYSPSSLPRHDLRSPEAVELPPLKMADGRIHRSRPMSMSPTDRKLPPIATLDIGNRDFAAPSGYFATSPPSQLPTAPTSPQDHRSPPQDHCVPQDYQPRLPCCQVNPPRLPPPYSREERRDKGSLAHLLEPSS
ncbi:myb-like DNA-binding domain-containing protein [Podospora aff. communis PSN243]|uniref:Myb-like DNA-binding domain-containing protein n=1 Tax=Podospora aff. communis PSN243 TaxID=3040156 RepID=A0AAV9GJD3_9PEZI|nr:myb-like DNA-binding domain-containing protein [Podospora aff. communis PSN243]